jgi:hypothetical protein
MRRFFSRQLLILMLAGMTVESQVESSGQNGKAPGGQSGDGSEASSATSPAPTSIAPGITVTGKPPPTERQLPTLPPTEFMDCVKESGGEELKDITFCTFKLGPRPPFAAHDLDSSVSIWMASFGFEVHNGEMN